MFHRKVMKPYFKTHSHLHSQFYLLSLSSSCRPSIDYSLFSCPHACLGRIQPSLCDRRILRESWPQSHSCLQSALLSQVSVGKRFTPCCSLLACRHRRGSVFWSSSWVGGCLDFALGCLPTVRLISSWIYLCKHTLSILSFLLKTHLFLVEWKWSD